MSRSRHGGKALGYEYWSRRLGNGAAPQPCKEVKVRTHRLERLRDKQMIRDELSIHDSQDRYEEELDHEEWYDNFCYYEDYGTSAVWDELMRQCE